MSTRGPNGVTRQAVLDYLIREADMDGLVTVSELEIGAAVGVARGTIPAHLNSLRADGLLEVVGRTSGVKAHSVNAIQLAESVFA